MSCNCDSVRAHQKTLLVFDVLSLGLFPVTTQAETHCFHLLLLTSTPAAFKAQHMSAASVSLFGTYGGVFLHEIPSIQLPLVTKHILFFIL